MAHYILQKWPLQYIPSHTLFLQCDLNTPPIAWWVLNTLPLKSGGPFFVTAQMNTTTEVIQCDLQGHKNALHFALIT